jgi:hypothetical protein
MLKLTNRFVVSAVVALTSLALLTSSVAAQSTKSTAAEAGALAVFSGLYIVIMLCFCVLGVVVFAAWIYLIVDATQRDYGNDTNMLAVGILFLVFLGFPIGFILYWAMIMTKYPKKGQLPTTRLA